MATKLIEKKAFAKLCKAFPTTFCSLDLDMVKYSGGDTIIRYKAYASDGNESTLSNECKCPMEAVDDVLRYFNKLEVTNEP